MRQRSEQNGRSGLSFQVVGLLHIGHLIIPQSASQMQVSSGIFYYETAMARSRTRKGIFQTRREIRLFFIGSRTTSAHP
jgi:hypothetical protein